MLHNHMHKDLQHITALQRRTLVAEHHPEVCDLLYKYTIYVVNSIIFVSRIAHCT